MAEYILNKVPLNISIEKCNIFTLKAMHYFKLAIRSRNSHYLRKTCLIKIIKKLVIRFIVIS